MIDLSSDIPNNIVELARAESIGDYAREYKDDLAKLYEDLNLIFIPFFPLDFDLPIFQTLVWSQEYKKLGSKTGMDADILVRDENKISIMEHHIMMRAFNGDFKIASYIRSQIAQVNAQIKVAMRALFPKYYSMTFDNIT